MNITRPYIVHEIPGFCDILRWNNHRFKKARIAQQMWIRGYYRTRASEAQNHHCCYCGTKMVDTPSRHNSITLEHIIPKSLGGLDHPDNYAAACDKCNSKRGNLPLDEFLAILGLTVSEPVL